MADKKLTLNDLSKQELLWTVEAMPSAKAFFTQERIARCMMMRKYTEALRLSDGFDVALKEIRRTRSRAAKASLIRRHNARVARYETLVMEIEALKARFPQVMEKLRGQSTEDIR